MDYPLSFEWSMFIIIVIALFVIIIALAWDHHRSKALTRRKELEIEQEKLDILKKDMAAKVHPFTKLSTEQLDALRNLESENEALEVNNYAKERLVESRIRKLENLVRGAKLDQMLRRIDDEEKKVR